MSIHFASDKSLHRPGYIYDNQGVGYPANNRAWILWNHIDGPLLHFRNGELHWLTLRERFMCWLGRDNAATIEFKRKPHLCR